MVLEATHQYNDPNTTPSSIDEAGGMQMNTFFWQRKALIEAQKEMYFMPLADTVSMPKHYGKEIKVYHYIPLLDDRNINDQGIDAAGAVISSEDFTVQFRKLTMEMDTAGDATDLAAAVNAIEAGVASTSTTTLTLTKLKLDPGTEAQANAILDLTDDVTVTQGSGNLYGSSKDIGTITGKLPTLTETGGRKNRVGFTRITRSGSLHKFGFFTEWTQETMDFDSDAELYSHISREMVTGATQLTEAVLQKDLLAGAGVTVYTGEATDDSEISGETTEISEVSYDDLMRLARTLNDNRTPKQTKVIKGSRMIDTRTVSNGRVMYIGSELEATVKGMKDQFKEPAFIPAHKYADAANLLNGEIGAIDQFRSTLR